MPEPAPAVPDEAVPLVIDLDGTLLLTDTFEVMTERLRRSPLHRIRLARARRRGKDQVKLYLWKHAGLDVRTLPVNHELLTWIRGEKDRGRRIVLATGSAVGLAAAVAALFGVFDDVIATETGRNLTGHVKAAVLADTFGERGFDYAGNSAADLAVWARARRAVLCDVPPDIAHQARALCQVERVFSSVSR